MNRVREVTDNTKITIGSADKTLRPEKFAFEDYKDIHSISTLEGTGEYPEYTLSHTSFIDYKNNNGGVVVHIRRILAQGWIFKKGSGIDFFCNRGFKPRWAILALVASNHHEYEIPALLTYWNKSSGEPSTYLPLTNAIVVDGYKQNSNYYSHRFTVIPNGRQTRHFSAPQRQRDEWVHLIHIAMRDSRHKKKEFIKDSCTKSDTSNESVLSS